VREPISRKPSFLLAVEGCISAYQETGHDSYVIEDQRPERAFTLERRLLLACVFLRANNRARYFEVLNQLDRNGDQRLLESILADSVPL
jgi:hypothetical protein